MWFWLACRPMTASYVEPFDGASELTAFAPLKVHLAGNFPADEPVPADLVSVVDLDSGGPVAGSSAWSDGAVVFEADEPWRAGGVYAWAVSAPVPTARAPQLDVPTGVVGEASFRIGGAPVLLDAVVEDGALCLLFSSPVDEIPRLAAGDAVWESPPITARAVALPTDDADEFDAVCVDLGPVTVAEGDLVRAWDRTGDTSAAPLSPDGLELRWEQRHRWVAP